MPADPLFDRLARALAGRYTLVRELGQGGMATVYLATDIKLGNILLSRGHAMVSDFGIAKVVAESGAAADRASLTGTGVTVGTAEYMSPEQASGGKRVDARSDVYALAAVLYEMLAGEPPFTGPSVQVIIARVLSDPPPPIRTLRPSLPAHVEAALAAGLAKLPADRPPTARTFVDMLTRPTADRRVPRPRWLKLGVAALLLGGAGIALWVGARRPPPASGAPAGMVLVPRGTYRVGGGPGRPTPSSRSARSRWGARAWGLWT